MDVRRMRNEALGKRVVKALESRNMEAYYASTKEEAVQKALELMEEGSSVTMGGSMSVRESGLLDAINAGNYEFYDRDQAATPEERQEIALKAFTCDWYLGSVNAMSENGVFVNIDGNANRVAAYAFGPKNVLLIVGMNKVVKSEEERCKGRETQARLTIAHENSDLRLHGVKNGSCFDCKSSDCICCQVLVTRFSRIPKRFKIILVDDVLGF